jgi:hypothetical protein
MSEPTMEYPKLCHLCGQKIGSRLDLDWHGIGNCAPICERCTGSGIDPGTDSEHRAALAQLREPMECGHPKACRVEQPHRVMVNLPDEPARSEPVFRCSACDQRDAALALFARRVAGHEPTSFIYGLSGNYAKIKCSKCGWIDVTWQQHILSLADPKALTEHDAALVAPFQARVDGLINSAAQDYRERKQLEADNAALREQNASRDMAKLPCGHPKACLVAVNDASAIGQKECGWCLSENKLKAALKAQIASAEAKAYRRCANELQTSPEVVDDDTFLRWAAELEKQKAEASK